MRMLLGELLVNHKLITENELNLALESQRLSNKRRLGDILLESDRISRTDLLKMLALQLEILFLDLDKTEIDSEVAKLFPEKLALKYGCLPVRKEGASLLVAMADPLNLQALDDLRQTTRAEIRPAVADREQIEFTIKKIHNKDNVESISNSIKDTEGTFRVVKQADGEKDTEQSVNDLKMQSQQAPIVRIVNLVINEAIQENASDIHIEPQADSLIVRDRIDGVLYEVHQLPRWIHGAVVSRIKIMADMDIAEKRIPQDGKVRISADQGYYDLRISTLPSIFGEKVVIRLLNRKESHATLDSLGLDSGQLEQIRMLNARKQGLILLTGPTGSGKSTTLNAILQEMRTPEVNIVTVEDPVEYDISKTTQVQVNPKTGLTFPNALRSILRQDPDIIMVGEIRDSETAEIVLRAAMTGHLVLSTLHTNDAPSAITRLTNLGAPPFLISSTILYILAQRLVRRLCEHCSIFYEPSADQVLQVERFIPQAAGLPWKKGQGCPQCKQRGYQGRIAVGELLCVNDEIRTAIEMQEPESVIQKLAALKGMKPLISDFVEKVHAGVTAITELWNVIVGDEIAAKFCPDCGGTIQYFYLACPFCGRSLKEKCLHCGQQLEQNWRFCPYCQSDCSVGRSSDK